MRQTKLVEIPNKTNDLLRGILLLEDDNKKTVLMCGGFERLATAEKKFKALADKLIERDISSLRFDYTGCGLSDGDFSTVTIKRIADDMRNAIEFLRLENNTKNIIIVCHSLAACAAGEILKEENFEKIVLIAPALNQKDLLRYWFVTSCVKNKKSELRINWRNFREYLDEDGFQKDCRRTDKMAKYNYISSAYFLENETKDYSSYFKNNQNILHIHGDNDDKVPLESLNAEFRNKIIVKDGDHDLERPDMFEQWINIAIGFITA